MCSLQLFLVSLSNTRKTCIAFVKVLVLVTISCVDCSVVRVEVPDDQKIICAQKLHPASGIQYAATRLQHTGNCLPVQESIFY